MKYVLYAMRPQQWVKNIFVFIPILVSGSFFNISLLLDSFIAFISFCLAASIVYLFNDIIDFSNDKNHPKKKYRPIASGKISKNLAFISILIILFFVFYLQNLAINNIWIIIILYLILNLNYSLWLKKIIIIDVICISIGFILRVQAGVVATGLENSEWLISMTFTLAMLLALGKRKAELENYGSNLKSRDSLQSYTSPLINVMQIIFVTCTIVFYLLYTNLNSTFDGNSLLLSLSSIFVVAGLLRYVQLSFDNVIEEDPTNILYKDKFILSSVILWGFIIILSFFI